MARMKTFTGEKSLMVHKHRGSRWSVRTNRDSFGEVFDWLSDNFGEEDYENGPWAKVGTQSSIVWSDSHSTYDITDEKIVAMMILRWS